MYSELALIMRGYSERQQRALRQRRKESAWMVSWLLLPHKKEGADPLTPDDLMGRKPRRKRETPAPKFSSPGEAAQAFFAARAAKAQKQVRRLTDGQ
jgi:hypothetical protein